MGGPYGGGIVYVLSFLRAKVGGLLSSGEVEAMIGQG